MQTQVFEDYSSLSRATAGLISEYIRKKKNSLVCLASGHTPLGTFQCLVNEVKEGKLDLSECTFVGLDEWLGFPRNQPGSCRQMMDESFFEPLQIPGNKIQFFNGLTENPEAEAEQINQFIGANGGLDIILVGIGTNGHIAMNEPGTSFHSKAHVSILSEETKSTGQKYFSKATELSKGITLGLQHLQDARLSILIANGPKKSTIVNQALTQPPSELLPASVFQLIKNSFVMLDRDAASELDIR